LYSVPTLPCAAADTALRCACCALLRPLQVDNVKLEAAHHLLKPFCLRRLKEEVERNMPPKVGAGAGAVTLSQRPGY
jgi:hypothetical protein